MILCSIKLYQYSVYKSAQSAFTKRQTPDTSHVKAIAIGPRSDAWLRPAVIGDHCS